MAPMWQFNAQAFSEELCVKATDPLHNNVVFALHLQKLAASSRQITCATYL
jgi:hypothetical protein